MDTTGSGTSGRCPQPNPTMHLTLQNDQLMSEHGILCRLFDLNGEIKMARTKLSSANIVH
jgi:hypothetical protein